MVKIKKLVIVSVLALASAASLTARASLFDDEVDARESAEAIIHCAEEAKGLFKGSMREYLAPVSAKHKKSSAKVDHKRYTFQVMSGLGLGLPPTKGNVLYVDVKVTQAPDGLTDAPASLEWSCELEKN